MSDQQTDDWAQDAWDATADDDLDFDTDGTDAESVGSRLTVDRVGKYHFEIADAKERFETISERGGDRFPDILVSCCVLEAVEGQSPRGAFYYHNLILADKGGGKLDADHWARQSTIEFLTGIGVLKKKDGQVIDPETGSTKIAIKTLATRLKGMQFVGDIKRNTSKDPKYDDKFELKFGRGAFEVDDPAVANVPKNREALALIGKVPAELEEKPKPKASGKKRGRPKKKTEDQSELQHAGASGDNLLDDPSL